MAFLVHNPHDCSIPYKKFQELTDKDFLFMIDYKSMSIKNFEVSDIKVVKVKEWDDRKNCLEVKLRIIGFDNDHEQSVYDGNCFIYSFYSNGEGTFFATDERIAKIVLDILRQKNSYQWSCFTSIFGNPMGRYAVRDIKLR